VFPEFLLGWQGMISLTDNARYLRHLSLYARQILMISMTYRNSTQTFDGTTLLLYSKGADLQPISPPVVSTQ